MERVSAPSQRITSLKERIFTSPNVDIERARLLTSSFKETEIESMTLRRAKALYNILAGVTICIHDDELIVGSLTSKPRAAPVLPEYSAHWLKNELELLDKRGTEPFQVSESEKEELQEILLYWRGKTVFEKAMALLPQETRRLYGRVSALEEANVKGIGCICVDYEKVLRLGLNGIKEQVLRKLESLDAASPEYLRKMPFLWAVQIALDGVINFAERYAELALALAKGADQQRRIELERIAEICRWVPANPARTFHEALQSIWFVHIALMAEAHAYGFTLGRLDQYLYPFYRQDILNGKLSTSEAIELLECLFVKANEYVLLLDQSTSEFFCGFPMTTNIILGGQKRDGKDAVNDLSYLCLDADADAKLPQPELVIRVNRWTPTEFLIRACEHARFCRGKIKFVNDDMAIPMLLNRGVSLEDARDYVLVGCCEPAVPGKSQPTAGMGGMINLLKCLELALKNGIDPITGEQIGPTTGDPSNFNSFDDVMEAYRVQVDFFTRHHATIVNAVNLLIPRLTPTPLQSALIFDCIGRCLDVTAGGAYYNFQVTNAVGLPNVGDSLAAIKKCVFEDKAFTMRELIEALDKKFEGREEIRSVLMKAPKFGNANDYVDLLTRHAGVIFCRAVEGHRNPRGGGFYVGFTGVTAHIPFGAGVGATPDGRKGGEPLADGGVSPVHGRNVNGPTATMTSVSKLDLLSATNGSVLNMRFNPEAVSTESRLRKLASMIQTYFELGGYHVQFNFVDTETLKEAQKYPERHRDLLVRVATYTSYFTDLSKEVQDDIIARIEFGSV